MDDPRKRQTGPERRSKEGDRGHKKTLPTNGGKVNTPDRHLRSTEGQIATKAKTSRRKVSETVRVLQHGTPELIDKMLGGEIPFVTSRCSSAFNRSSRSR